MIKRVIYFGNPAYLSLKNAQMVIRMPNVPDLQVYKESDQETFTRTIPVEDIGFVILDNAQITITQALLSALSDNNTALITCNHRHMPSSLMLPMESHSLQSMRYASQINCSVPLRKQLWQQTVRAKIYNQAMALKCVTNAPYTNLLKWKDEVLSDDKNNLEGRAAAYYWKSIFVDNPKFKRCQDGEHPNDMLNYGYAILRAIVARALVASGLLPTLGIHHHNKYNAYCLADDIMEPYRPYIDMHVLKILEKYPQSTELTTEIKRDLLTIPVLDVTVNSQRCPLMIGVMHTTASLEKCYDGTIKKIVYPEIC